MPNMKTVTVEAKLVERYKIETRSRQHIAMVDQPPSGGGTDAGPTPLEYLFISLAGCLGTVAQMIARQRRLPFRGIEIKIEGDLDLDVIMGKSKDVRAGFQNIRVVAKIDADMTQAEKEAFLHEIDERCPISDNILNLTPVEFIAE